MSYLKTRLTEFATHLDRGNAANERHDVAEHVIRVEK